MHCQWLNGQCRVCAIRTTSLINIFSEEGLKQNLQCKLYNCLKIIVTSKDVLPTTLCEICVSRINEFYKLVEDCWKGQTYFSSMQYPSEVQVFDVKQNSNIQESIPVCSKSEKDQPARVYVSSHEKNCRCRKCEIIRYGALPLVVELIEDKKVSDTEKLIVVKTSPIEDIETKDVFKENDEMNEPDTLPLDLQVKCIDKESDLSDSSSTRKTKIFECTDCGKLFKHRGDFNKHLRKHTGERPFECPECHRRFAHTSNLTRHLRVHTGVKPFKCDKCERLFSRKDKLACHRKCKSVNLQSS